MNRIIYLMTGLLITVSCSTYEGTMTGNASISNANFQNLGVAIGTAEAFYVAGIGGTKSKTLVLDAKRDLYANHAIYEGQALANVTVDETWTNYVVFVKRTITISADIIDFNTPLDSLKFKNEALIGRNINQPNGFKVGDSVQINTDKYSVGKIVGMADDKVYIEKFYNSNDIKYLKASYKDVQNLEYSRAINDAVFHVGDSVLFQRSNKIQNGLVYSVGYDKINVLNANKLILIPKNRCMKLD